MLYVFFGNDGILVRQKAHGFLDEEAGEKDARVQLSAETYTPGVLAEMASASSLFTDQEVVLVDSFSLDEETFEELLASVEALATSTNIFVVIEDALTAEQKKVFSTHAIKMVEVKKAATKKFNPFLLADGLAHRDKKSLWLLLNEAWRNGVSNEEIVGILFWQIKVLRLAECTRSASEAGQKPFVYDKAKRALQKFKKGELEKMSREVVSMYHDGHLGKRDMSLALERWVLEL